MDGEQCVRDIARYLHATSSNISQHLALMEKAGLVTRRKEGLHAWYALRTRLILHFFHCLLDITPE